MSIEQVTTKIVAKELIGRFPIKKLHLPNRQCRLGLTAKVIIIGL